MFWTKAPGTWGDPQWFFDYPELPTLAPWRTVQPLGTGTTLILAEQNVKILKIADRIFGLEAGKIRFCEKTEDLDEAVVKELYMG